ncbi:MAG TPA: HEAT repeat domain-containing protein, partial [Polyangiaceae bacterium]
KLATSEETDRAAVLTALGGVLSRVPTPQAIKRLDHELELSAGADRDALLVAMARAKSPDAMPPLARLSKSEFAEDRRAVAALLPARTHAEASTLATTLLADTDATVRAQAAWSMGTIGDASAAPALSKLAQAGDMDTSIDATAALARIAARSAKQQAATWLCPLLDHAHPYVRANALVGLALSQARCGDGTKERRLLLFDDADVVRGAAARAVGRTDPEDVRALESCAGSDRSGTVARKCRTAFHPPASTAPLLVYVVAEDGVIPIPKSAYAIVLADGLIHVGTADRRGAVFDPVTPAGEVSLDRPSAARANK